MNSLAIPISQWAARALAFAFMDGWWFCCWRGHVGTDGSVCLPPRALTPCALARLPLRYCATPAFTANKRRNRRSATLDSHNVWFGALQPCVFSAYWRYACVAYIFLPAACFLPAIYHATCSPPSPPRSAPPRNITFVRARAAYAAAAPRTAAHMARARARLLAVHCCAPTAIYQRPLI